MKKWLAALFLMVLCIASCACANTVNSITSANTMGSTTGANATDSSTGENMGVSFLDQIMFDTSKEPRLTKDEFINIINSNDLLNIPYEKACFQTSGFNFTGYIVADNFLFTVFSSSFRDEDNEYQLTYYKNGKPVETVNSVAEFQEFLDKYGA